MKIYNSLTNEKTEFVPIKPNHVSLYACGMTVYDYCHIGHARAMIVFDIVVRYFRLRGYTVQYVNNITDIDDKIIRRANENQEDWPALTQRFIDAMHEDQQALGLLSPDAEPRATQYIAPIITLIQQIIANGNAYVAANGDVCFEVRKFAAYGKLSHRKIDDLQSGARVELGESKRDPLDFVLWKLAKPNEPKWDSPWGEGRPGWHIECSAMSTDLLGQPFDIHGGGMDLKFPHHENEIAQSEAACGDDFAHTWMHVGLLQVNGEKMSKSLGNFFTIRDVMATYSAELIRYFMISGHYRSPVNYSEESLSQLKASLDRLYIALRGLPATTTNAGDDFQEKFYQAMDDDFNTPVALSVLFDLAHHIQRLRQEEKIDMAAACGHCLKQLADTFGILQQDPEIYFQGADDIDAKEIIAMIAERQQARAEKDWKRADRIRDELIEKGIIIDDASAGTTWRRQ
jgi:cysteinyl-tRNA synthetase